MVAAKKGGFGSALGCLIVLGGLGYAGWKFGPQILAKLRGPPATVEWGQVHDAKNGIRVRVLAAAIEPTEVEDALGSRDGTDDLHVTLEITNLTDTPVRYRPPRVLGVKDPKLTDDQGRAVPAAAYGDKARIVGQLADNEEIAPHDRERHDLVFRTPSETAKHLLLEVDTAMFGGDGVARFRIPVERIDGFG